MGIDVKTLLEILEKHITPKIKKTLQNNCFQINISN